MSGAGCPGPSLRFIRTVLSVVKARCSSYCEPRPGDLELFDDARVVEVHGSKLSNDVRISRSRGRSRYLAKLPGCECWRRIIKAIG